MNQQSPRIDETGQPYDLTVALPYQLRWLADDTKVKIGDKSRRIGLTWIEAGDSVLLAATDTTEGGMDVYYISTRQELAHEFIDTAAQWAIALLPYDDYPIEEGFIADAKQDILTYKIRFVSGHTITALSSKPSNLRGLAGRIIIDEAAYHEDLAALLKAAIACTMWRGQIRIISTHHGEDNHFNKLIESFLSGKWTKGVSYHKITINKALEEGLFKRICATNAVEWSQEAEEEFLEELLQLYGDDALEELFCEPNTGTGAYFTRDMVSDSASDEYSVLRYALPAAFVQTPKYEQTQQVAIWLETFVKPYVTKLSMLNYKTYAGLDFGRSHDLTVLSILVEDWGHARYVPFMLELRNVPFHCQEQICKYVLGGLKKFRKAAFDSTGNGSFLAESMALEFGSARINQIKMSQDFYLQHFPRYKAALESKRVTIPYDEDVISDHRLVQLVNGIPKVPAGVLNRGSDGKDRHGDAAISLMLAYSTLPDENTGKGRVLPTWARPTSYYDFS